MGQKIFQLNLAPGDGRRDLDPVQLRRHRGHEAVPGDAAGPEEAGQHRGRGLDRACLPRAAGQGWQFNRDMNFALIFY